jgi:glycosyltransferase involved in cell wall biosynthesis
MLWLRHFRSIAGYAVRRVKERPSTLLLVPAALLLRRVLAVRRWSREVTAPGKVLHLITSSAGALGLTPGRVSVVLPASDAGSAEACLARLSVQTHRDTEIIVVLRGPDRWPHGALASSGFHRVRMIGVSGDELSQALTAGFSVATGEYWTWMTHPVVSDPGCLEVMAAALAARPDVDLVCFNGDETPANAAPEAGAGGLVSRFFLVRGSAGLALGGASAVVPVDAAHGTLRAAVGLRVEHVGNAVPGHPTGEAPHETPLRVLVKSGSRTALSRLFPLARLMAPGATGPFDALVASSWRAATAASDAASLAVTVRPDDIWPGWIGAVSRAVPRERIAVVVEQYRAGEVAALFAPAVVMQADAPQTAHVLESFIRRCARHQGEVPPKRDNLPWTIPHVLDRPMRVLCQVVDFTRGGLEKVVLELGSDLRTRHIEVALLVTGRAGDDVALAQSNGWQVIVDPRGNEKGQYGSLLDTFAPDVVHAHDAWFGADACAARQIPFVQTLHNCHVWLTDRARAQARLVDPATTAYACVSEQVARYAGLALELDVAKMVLVPNGVSPAWERRHWDPVTRLAAREELGLPTDQLVYVCVASILPAKAQRALVKAFAKVRATEPAARLLLVGGVINRAYWADVRRTIESTPWPGAVTHVPFTDRPDQYLAAADIFVLPSIWEGWSLALAEAVVMGLPVVATRVGSAAAFEMSESVHVIDPPFEAIETLTPDTIRSFSWHDDVAFVDRLADAMTKAARLSSSTRRVPRAIAEHLSNTGAHETYVQMYRWLAQGGSVQGLRRLAGDRASLA